MISQRDTHNSIFSGAESEVPAKTGSTRSCLPVHGRTNRWIFWAHAAPKRKPSRAKQTQKLPPPLDTLTATT